MSKVNALVLLQKYRLYLGLGIKQCQYSPVDSKTYCYIYEGKGKDKVRPRTGHEGPERE
jgi:hypothetical protein